ncbi:T-cell receptor beta chain [Triplophysa rosa]|nr:T-cell receptor beta chain [Triplophysa rosa]
MEFTWLILILLLTIHTANGVIRQEPKILCATEDSNVTLKCEHDNADHYRLYWYKQAKDNIRLKLIVFSAGQYMVDIEAPFNTADLKYNATRPEVKRSTLQIKRVEAEDSALYYCATSTQYNKQLHC